MGELLMPREAPGSFIDKARKKLQEEWDLLTQRGIKRKEALPIEISDAISRSVNSKTLTYRYVLPTQILAKVVMPALDCHSIQAGSGLQGSFDARSLCHRVIVDFDRENDSVLGGSKEPYLNNPLRIPAIRTEYRTAQKDKVGFDDLLRVLDFIEEHSECALPALRVVLLSISERLRCTSLTYPVPNRVSLAQCCQVVSAFVAERTGGMRLQTVCVALFRCIGQAFGAFSAVEAANINAADSSTGSAADLECKDDEGNVVLAVEVKDRQLALRHALDKLPGARSKGIRELIFLVQGGIAPAETESVKDLIDREFVTGQNIYVCEFAVFLESCLVLLGEKGRRLFLECIGKELDDQRVDIDHRRKWAELLASI